MPGKTYTSAKVNFAIKSSSFKAILMKVWKVAESEVFA